MTNTVHRVLQHIHKVALVQTGAGLADGELLERYVTRRDDAAFAALVLRHGAMVLGVCRRILGNEADAEDAFQATFLVLVRKAGSIRPRGMVSNWLYGVAHNTALKGKAMNRRRRVKEREAGMVKAEPAPEVSGQAQELLDAELSRLPDRYRAAIVMCDLQGKTIKEATSELGWPQGTVATRLTRGRALLARRLAARGLPVTSGVVSALLAEGTVSAAMPPALAAGIIRAASLYAADSAATTGVVSAHVAALAEGVLKTMFVTKHLTVTAVLLVVVLLGGGLTLGLAQGLKDTAALSPATAAKADGPAKADGVPKPKTDGEWLQGVWKVELAAANGIHLKREEETTQVWQIAGNKITIQYQDGAMEVMTYQLDTTRKPRTIDLVPDGADKGEALPGIYAFDGNALKVCFTKGKPPARPTTFEQELEFSRDRGRRLFVLRRDPPKKSRDEPRPASEQGRSDIQPPDRPQVITGFGQGALPGKNKNPPDKPLTAEDQFKALVKEFDDGAQHVMRRDGYEKRVLQLAQMNPKEPFAVDALLWILKRGWQPNGGILIATTMPFGQSASKALELLARDHAEDKRAGAMAEFLGLAPVEADPFLRALMEKNPDRSVQARSCLALACRARWFAEQARFNTTVVRPADTEEERKQFERMKDKWKVDEEQLYKEAEKYFELATRKYSDVAYFEKWTLADVAGSALFEVRCLRIGMTAPEIEGEDVSGKKLKLSDYRGKVVLLDFYWWGNAPSKTIYPFERSLMKTFEDRPFTILGIHREPDRQALTRMRQEEKITWPSWFDVAGPAAGRWLDGGNTPGPIAVRWSVRHWPTLYLLDHKGVIRERSIGFMDMEKGVEQLVQEAEAAAK